MPVSYQTHAVIRQGSLVVVRLAEVVPMESIRLKWKVTIIKHKENKKADLSSVILTVRSAFISSMMLFCNF